MPARPIPPSELGPENVAGVQRRNLADALFKAIIRCRFQRVKFLLDNGVSPLVVNDGNQNVLIAALYIQDPEKRDTMFRYLVRRGADCCFIDKTTGRDVTSWAAYLGRASQVECIFKSVVGEVDLHAEDDQGMAPLHHAVTTGHVDTVKVLVKYMQKYDLSLDIPDSRGLSPYIYSRRLGHNDISEVLRDGGCSTSMFDSLTYKSAEEWADIGRKERQKQLRKEKEMERTGLMRRAKNNKLPSVHRNVKLPALKITSSKTDTNVVMIEISSPAASVVSQSARSISPITIVGEETTSDHLQIKKQDQQQRKRQRKNHQEKKQKKNVKGGIEEKTVKRQVWSANSQLFSIDYRLREDTRLLLGLQHISASTNNITRSSYDNLGAIMGIVAQQCTHTFRPSIIPPKPPKPSNKGKFSSLAFVLRAGKKGKQNPQHLVAGSNSRSASPAVSEKKTSVTNMASFMGALTTGRQLGDDKKKKKLFPSLATITSS